MANRSAGRQADRAEVFVEEGDVVEQDAPIARLEDRKFETPGPVTGQVLQLMNDIIEFKDERFVDWFQPLD